MVSVRERSVERERVVDMEVTLVLHVVNPGKATV